MVRATQQAIAYTLAHPDEAFQIRAQAAVPEAGGENEAANRAIFDASLAYWMPTPARRPGPQRERWQAAAEFMQRTGLVDKVVPAAELFSNEYLP